MASTDVSMNINRMAHHITMNVRVKGMRVFVFRWWVARQVLKLAALIAGCGLNVHTSQPD